MKMNVSIQFYTDRLPVAYRMCMLSLIKECIRRGDESVYLSYYSNNRPKPFTFSVFLQNFEIGLNEIKLTGFRLNLSSSDYQFLVPFLNGLQRTKQLQYKGYSILRGPIQYGREQKVQSSKILVKTNSPILVEDEQGRPLSPFDPFYNLHLNNISTKISVTMRGVFFREEIRIHPISVRKIVIKESNEAYEKAVAENKASNEYLYFTAYKGRFVMEGDPSDLQWLLDTGVGLRASQGFGHVRLESEVMAYHEA